MFFSYPVQAIEENWIHECIQAAFEKICSDLDAQNMVPDWPDMIPEGYRERLRSRKKLPQLLASFKNEAGKLSPENRAEFLNGFRQQNKIVNLLDGSLPIPTFSDGLNKLLASAKAVCDEGYLLLGRLAIRNNQYKIIYERIEKKGCPFCGMVIFDAPSLPSEDDDHYLARSIYPLAAANFFNLAPMCGKCNQKYKGTKDIIRPDGVRKKALNPYGQITTDITLINSSPLDGRHGKPAWKVDLIPNIEETETWDSVFSIRKRLIETILEPRFDEWFDELSDWFSAVGADTNIDNNTLINTLNSFIDYKVKHRDIGADFFKPKLFELFAHHCKNGNEKVIAMIRYCLPNNHAA